jgi:hypothetical protein
MLRNAHRVSLHDIVLRQHLLGGVDLRLKSPATAVFLRRFYAYAQACIRAVQDKGQPPLWSHWRDKTAECAALLAFIDHSHRYYGVLACQTHPVFAVQNSALLKFSQGCGLPVQACVAS